LSSIAIYNRSTEGCPYEIRYVAAYIYAIVAIHATLIELKKFIMMFDVVIELKFYGYHAPGQELMTNRIFYRI
jgi:hypothetical protein